MNKAVKAILWLIYISLLGVLLPHTAWAFGMFEPMQSKWVSWAAAFAFEAAIAALTHKLSVHIEQTPKRSKGWPKFFYRYLNSYSVGLTAAIGISSLANLAHAVEFGGTMKIFTKWQIPFGVYAVVFGAILPMISLVFARVLSNVVESETELDPAIEQANNTIRELRLQLRQMEKERNAALQRFDAVGDMAIKLMNGEKRDRILAASQLWPELPGKSIALIADSSPAYVSEILNSIETIEK